jgi:cytochrome c556
MDAIGNNMDELESIVEASKIELVEAKDHADTISVMLLSFPHLFPPSTNQWKPDAVRDPGRDTFAAPDVWTNYGDFYKRADAASKIAFNASRSEDEAGLKKHTAELRNACDTCHAIYMKKD